MGGSAPDNVLEPDSAHREGHQCKAGNDLSDFAMSAERVKVYIAYLDDLGRIGSRHETQRAYYVSLITALSAFLAVAGEDGLLLEVKDAVMVIVGSVGTLVCVAWGLQMGTFRAVYRAKLKTLRDLEALLDPEFHPFTLERSHSTRGSVGLSSADLAVSFGGGALFVMLVAIKLAT